MGRYRIPAICVLLVALGSFRFERHTATSSISYDGPVVGTITASLIGLVLLFRLTSRWADYVVASGSVLARPRFRFDSLIVAAIILPAFGYTARGPAVIDMFGKPASLWLFEWGQNKFTPWFMLSLLLVALLLRVYAIVSALAHKAFNDRGIRFERDAPS
jgi:hypothetical protein